MDVNLIKELKKEKDLRICDRNLGDPITVNEIGQVLKRMKNNKSPGIDGFTSEFFKVFYNKLQYFITNSINSCFKKKEFDLQHLDKVFWYASLKALKIENLLKTADLSLFPQSHTN